MRIVCSRDAKGEASESPIKPRGAHNRVEQVGRRVGPRDEQPVHERAWVDAMRARDGVGELGDARGRGGSSLGGDEHGRSSASAPLRVERRLKAELCLAAAGLTAQLVDTACRPSAAAEHGVQDRAAGRESL